MSESDEYPEVVGQVTKPVPGSESKTERKQRKPLVSTKQMLAVILAVIAISAGYVYATTYLAVTVPVTVSSMTFNTGTIDTGSCSGTNPMTCTPGTMIIGANVTLTIVVNNPTSALTANIYFNSSNTAVARIVLISVAATSYPPVEPTSPVSFLFPAFPASGVTATTTIIFHIVPIASDSATITIAIGT